MKIVCRNARAVSSEKSFRLNSSRCFIKFVSDWYRYWIWDCCLLFSKLVPLLTLYSDSILRGNIFGQSDEPDIWYLPFIVRRTEVSSAIFRRIRCGDEPEVGCNRLLSSYPTGVVVLRVLLAPFSWNVCLPISLVWAGGRRVRRSTSGTRTCRWLRKNDAHESNSLGVRFQLSNTDTMVHRAVYK